MPHHAEPLSDLPMKVGGTHLQVPMPEKKQGEGAGCKDGNGAPIPDSLRGIPLSGDKDEVKFIPTGIKMAGI